MRYARRVLLRRRPELQAAVDGTLLLTAHAAVLAALSGEADVVTGYVPADPTIGAHEPRSTLRRRSGGWRADPGAA